VINVAEVVEKGLHLVDYFFVIYRAFFLKYDIRCGIFTSLCLIPINEL